MDHLRLSFFSDREIPSFLSGESIIIITHDSSADSEIEVWYVYQVISTVVIVASTRIRTIAAANAQRHPKSDRARIDALVRAMKTMRMFKTAKAKRLRNVSVGEVRDTLRRRNTLNTQPTISRRKSRFWQKWDRTTKLACFRGFTAYLTMAVCQWFIPVTIDFFLSGQPSELKLGYGTSSIVLATLFGPGFAVWTHYAMTNNAQKRIRDHFPKGRNPVIELWEITACWAVSEQLAMSGPLALSRAFDLKKYAFDVESWNTLDESGQKRKIVEFCSVFILYLLLVAAVSVPATIVARRVYASMLSDEDLAIVPFHSGDRTRLKPYDDRATFRRPGLTVAEAFSTITWSDYLQVLLIYMQYFAINQFLQLSYWSANWKLHEVFEVEKYASTNLPCSPVGKVLPFSARNITAGALGGYLNHSEL